MTIENKKADSWIEKWPLYQNLRVFLNRRGFSFRGVNYDGTDTMLVFVNRAKTEVVEVRHIAEMDEEEIKNYFGD